VSPLACAEPIDAETSLTGLVEAAQAGDRDALGEIVRRFEGVVYATALRRLANHGEAQELAQEVFIQMMRKIGQLREPECLAGWLRSITHRLAINRLSRGRVETPNENEALEGNFLDRETPLASALKRERAAQVHAGLNRLGELDRDTLMAFYVEGQSLIEMSTAFESPVGTIKRRLHVARKRLARELEELAV
jgi:RNA polymerase sigma-70 factor, ECF subfamily